MDKEEPDPMGLEALFEGYHEGHFFPVSDRFSGSTNGQSVGQTRQFNIISSVCYQDC